MSYTSEKEFKITVLIRQVRMLMLVHMACMHMEHARHPVHSKIRFTVKLPPCFLVLLDNISAPFHCNFPKCKLGRMGCILPADALPALHMEPFLTVHIPAPERPWFLLLWSPNFRLCQSSLLTEMRDAGYLFM